MVKTIIIGNKQFNLKASALTPFIYAQVTNNQSNFFEELDKLKVFGDGKEISVEAYGKIQDFVLHLTYAMYTQCEKDNKMSFNDFVDSIEDMGDGKWIGEVLQLAMSTFPRAVQNAEQQQTKR